MRSSCRGGHGSVRRRRSGQGSRITSTLHSRSHPRAQPTPKPSHLTQLRRSRQRTQPQPPFSQLSDTQISNGSMAFVLCTVFLVGRLGHRRSRPRPPQRRCRCPTPRSQRSAPAPYNDAALTQRYARPHNVLSSPFQIRLLLSSIPLSIARRHCTRVLLCPSVRLYACAFVADRAVPCSGAGIAGVDGWISEAPRPILVCIPRRRRLTLRRPRRPLRMGRRGCALRRRGRGCGGACGVWRCVEA